MRPTTAEMVTAVERVCRALERLPLGALPQIGSMHVASVSAEPLRVSLQLMPASTGTATARLLAWFDAIPTASVAASWGKDYLRLEVSCVLAEENVAIWDHISGCAMTHVGSHLGMAAIIGSRDAVPVAIAALRQLAGEPEEANRDG